VKASNRAAKAVSSLVAKVVSNRAVKASSLVAKAVSSLAVKVSSLVAKVVSSLAVKVSSLVVKVVSSHAAKVSNLVVKASSLAAKVVSNRVVKAFVHAAKVYATPVIVHRGALMQSAVTPVAVVIVHIVMPVASAPPCMRVVAPMICGRAKNARAAGLASVASRRRSAPLIPPATILKPRMLVRDKRKTTSVLRSMRLAKWTWPNSGVTSSGSMA
jgi:hypothetical protein